MFSPFGDEINIGHPMGVFHVSSNHLQRAETDGTVVPYKPPEIISRIIPVILEASLFGCKDTIEDLND